MQRSGFFLLIALLGAASLIAAGSLRLTEPEKVDVTAMRQNHYGPLVHLNFSVTHNGRYIPPEDVFGCQDETECEAKGITYYKRVGALDASGNPTTTRGTMQAWLATNNFSPDPTHPAPGEIRTVYFNRADLGFGRDMHCQVRDTGIVKLPKPNNSPTALLRPSGGLMIGKIYACYVTNYGDIAHPLDPNGNEQQAISRARLNTSPIATVAMEVFRPSQGNAGEVRFFVYDTGGNVTDHHVTVPSQLKGMLIPFAILDNDTVGDAQKHKANPGTCMNCHGGQANHTEGNPNPSPADTVVTGANFLPFDAQLFGYDTTPGSSISEVNQREAMRKLNAFVKSSSPSAPSISTQIDGWYAWCGGVATIGCAIDDANHPYTPPSWLNSSSVGGTTASPASIVNLYQQVPRIYCRTCHLARQADFDVQNIAQANSVRSKLKPPTVSNPNIVQNMPHAERTFIGYWADANAQNAYSNIWP